MSLPNILSRTSTLLCFAKVLNFGIFLPFSHDFSLNIFYCYKIVVIILKSKSKLFETVAKWLSH